MIVLEVVPEKKNKILKEYLLVLREDVHLIIDSWGVDLVIDYSWAVGLVFDYSWAVGLVIDYSSAVGLVIDYSWAVGLEI